MANRKKNRKTLVERILEETVIIRSNSESNKTAKEMMALRSLNKPKNGSI